MNSVPQPPSPPASGLEDMEVDGNAHGDDIEIYDVSNETGSIVPIAGGSGAAACVPVPGAEVAIVPSFTSWRNRDQNLWMLTLSFPVPASDHLVFNGGSSRQRAIAYQPRPLLADQPSSVSDESLQPPLLSDTASVTIGDEDDTVERENKRPRVDSYEIALASNDVPRTYPEAMASNEAEQWKQAAHSEIHEDAEKVRDELSARFTLKSLDDARSVLGMEVKYDMEKGELILKQEHFITKMLQKFGCNDAHAARNPMVLG
ncbi:hypothetical protein PsorP6_015846 [Peronosclerospora sorghi]|uniref:Uncharacterized protein n=1 Tax=Peronosclerospora sorghi TaxID=230839 RepID=A0ACC0WQD2_9STRA|nr:hypothetical protein PsorP6_015846 [Peronosclerospora sorghi]